MNTNSIFPRAWVDWRTEQLPIAAQLVILTLQLEQHWGASLRSFLWAPPQRLVQIARRSCGKVVAIPQPAEQFPIEVCQIGQLYFVMPPVLRHLLRFEYTVVTDFLC
jgi:hypothetical protein